jgi:hypothetical protein
MQLHSNQLYYGVFTLLMNLISITMLMLHGVFISELYMHAPGTFFSLPTNQAPFFSRMACHPFLQLSSIADYCQLVVIF